MQEYGFSQILILPYFMQWISLSLKLRKNINKMNEKPDSSKLFISSYWSIANNFLNNIKIPNIPPLKVNSV